MICGDAGLRNEKGPEHRPGLDQSLVDGKWSD